MVTSCNDGEILVQYLAYQNSVAVLPLLLELDSIQRKEMNKNNNFQWKKEIMSKWS